MCGRCLRCGQFLQLLVDEFDQFFVRRPECLPDADGVIQYSDDGGVPVLASSIVENAIPADQEEIRIAGGKGGSDTHLFGASLPYAIAICKIKPAHVGKLRVFAYIVHPYAQVAAASIQV